MVHLLFTPSVYTLQAYSNIVFWSNSDRDACEHQRSFLYSIYTKISENSKIHRDNIYANRGI